LAVDYRIAALVALLVIAVAAYSLYPRTQPEPPTLQPVELTFEGEPANYTIAAGPGSTLAYEATSIFHAENGTTVNATTNYTLTITEYAWPFAQVNYTEGDPNRTTTASFLVGNIAVPQELLGNEHMCVPVSIPFANEGICIRLELAGRGNATLVYRGSANLSGIIVNALLQYSEPEGLLVKSTFNLTGPDGTLLFTHEQALVNYGLSAPAIVYTGDDWLCDPPLSSKAYLLWEGTYVLRPGPTLEPVPAMNVVAAVKSQGVVAVIAKDGRPLTDEFWQKILAAVDYTRASIYVIVVGPMATPDLNVLASDVLARASAPEYNVLIAFDGGRATQVVYSFAPPEEILVLLS